MTTYGSLDEAIKEAKEMSEILDTTVLITLENNGEYALFGNGKVVEKVE